MKLHRYKRKWWEGNKHHWAGPCQECSQLLIRTRQSKQGMGGKGRAGRRVHEGIIWSKINSCHTGMDTHCWQIFWFSPEKMSCNFLFFKFHDWKHSIVNPLLRKLTKIWEQTKHLNGLYKPQHWVSKQGMESLYKLSAICGTCLESHLWGWSRSAAEFQASLGYLLRHWREGVQRGDISAKEWKRNNIVRALWLYHHN